MLAYSLGWSPDIPDERDLIVADSNNYDLPRQVDLREHDLESQCGDGLLHMSCAVSLLSVIDWQSKKWFGNKIDGSAEFLHRLTVKIWGGGGVRGVGLRSTLKTLKRFGTPPQRLCENSEAKPLLQRPELFGYSRDFSDIEFVRLDPDSRTSQQTLDAMRAFLFNGDPLLIGFAVPHSISSNSFEVPLDFRRGGTMGGTACAVMGYDDNYPVFQQAGNAYSDSSGEKSGAFLIHTCWGNQWGERGYGWLPYAFVKRRFAVDAWVIKNQVR